MAHLATLTVNPIASGESPPAMRLNLLLGEWAAPSPAQLAAFATRARELGRAVGDSGGIRRTRCRANDLHRAPPPPRHVRPHR